MSRLTKKRLYRFERFGDQILLGFCVIISIVIMQWSDSSFAIRTRIWMDDKRTLIQSPICSITSLGKLRIENKRLKQQLAESLEAGQFYPEIWDENRRLRSFLGFAERVDFGFIPAEVIGRQWQGFPGLVHINAGWKQGCKKDMALVTHDGIAGKIVSVSRSGATGMLLNHPTFRISARIQRTRQVGIVRWLHGNRCALDGVPIRSDVQLGDRIVASGYGHIYPTGYLIGYVVHIADDPKGLFKIIELKTAVDLGQLELLFVVQKENNEPRVKGQSP